jgi:hypothetical protein
VPVSSFLEPVESLIKHGLLAPPSHPAISEGGLIPIAS